MGWLEDFGGFVVETATLGAVDYDDGKYSIDKDPLGGIGDAGHEFIKDITPNERFLNDILRSSVNISTAGFVDFKDGKIKEGVHTRVLKQGWDRLTGRDLVEEQMRVQEARIQQEERRRDTLLAEERVEAERADIMASNQAQATRRTSQAANNRYFGSPMERNFLGI